MNFYLDAWKKFVTFDGRARRKEFWFFMLINMVIACVLGVIPKAGVIIMSIFELAALLPGIAAGIRRMHDIGKSGWWLCIGFIPLIGFIWLLILTLKDSESGSNEYGDCPK